MKITSSFEMIFMSSEAAFKIVCDPRIQSSQACLNDVNDPDIEALIVIGLDSDHNLFGDNLCKINDFCKVSIHRRSPETMMSIHQIMTLSMLFAMISDSEAGCLAVKIEIGALFPIFFHILSKATPFQNGTSNVEKDSFFEDLKNISQKSQEVLIFS